MRRDLLGTQAGARCLDHDAKPVVEGDAGFDPNRCGDRIDLIPGSSEKIPAAPKRSTLPSTVSLTGRGSGTSDAENFRKSNNKAAYLYLLTPKGIKAKALITAHYLQRKLDEYEALQAEIEELRAEMAASD